MKIKINELIFIEIIGTLSGMCLLDHIFFHWLDIYVV